MQVDITEKKVSCIRLHEALKLFKKNDNVLLSKERGWVEFLKENGLEISFSTLSNHFTAVARNDFRNTNYYHRILKIVDEYIKTTYILAWDPSINKYTAISDEQQQKDRDSEYLAGLHGTWKTYSWNKKRYEGDKDTDRINGGLNPLLYHVNIAKFKIGKDTSVILETERSDFKGTIKLISDSKFFMDLDSIDSDRRLMVIGDFGPWKDLSDLAGFTLVYIDSGAEHVKCGLSVILRTTDSFESIKPMSYPAKDIPKKIVKFLLDESEDKGSQHIARIFEKFEFID